MKNASLGWKSTLYEHEKLHIYIYIYIYIYIERERLLSREKYVCLICTYDTSFTSNVERGVQMSVRAAEKLSRLSLISNNAISLLIFVRFFTIPFHFTLNPCYV